MRPTETNAATRLSRAIAILLIAAATLTGIPPAAASAATPTSEACAHEASSDVSVRLDTPRSQQVWRLYTAIFLREPKPEGLEYWTATKKPLSEIAQLFTQSTEFKNRYGRVDHETFVNQVFQNVLCRTPAASGQRYWASRLAIKDMTRGDMAVYLAEGKEYLQRTGTCGGLFHPEVDCATDIGQPATSTTTRPTTTTEAPTTTQSTTTRPVATTEAPPTTQPVTTTEAPTTTRPTTTTEAPPTTQSTTTEAPTTTQPVTTTEAPTTTRPTTTTEAPPTTQSTTTEAPTTTQPVTTTEAPTTTQPVTTTAPTTTQPVTTTEAPTTTQPVTTTTTQPTTTTTQPTTTTTQPTTTTTQPNVWTPEGTPVWTDEFDTLDTNTWRKEHSTYGDGNGEQQCYRPENASVQNGKLVLKAVAETYTCPNGETRQYTSGMVRSQGVTFSHGQTLAFRIKLDPNNPDDQSGLFPAVWSAGWNGGGWPTGGEFDYFAVNGTRNEVTNAVRYGSTETAWGGDSRTNLFTDESDYFDGRFSDNWHTVTFTWGDELVWTLDGAETYRLTASEIPAVNNPFLDTANPIEQLRVTFALGGSWIGHLGPDTVDAQGNTTFEMDWIRIYGEPSIDPDGPLSVGTPVWVDEFDTLDTNTWRQEHSTYGDGNAEDQCYRPENSFVQDGKLTLMAVAETYTCPNGSTRQATSGMVRSQGVTFSPGQTIAYRVKINPNDPNDQDGLFPAVWASSWNGGGWPTGGEFDFMEYFGRLGQANAAIHYHSTETGRHAHTSQKIDAADGSRWSDNWHTFTFTWGEDLVWTMDGVETMRLAAADIPATSNPFLQDARSITQLKVNFALGGTWNGPLGPNSIDADGNTTFQMDWIAIYD